MRCASSWALPAGGRFRRRTACSPATIPTSLSSSGSTPQGAADGKRPRPGMKLGHVTVVADTRGELDVRLGAQAPLDAPAGVMAE